MSEDVREAGVRVAGVRVAGVLLAAGAGRRMGQPKALVRGGSDSGDDSGSGEAWVVRGARVLLDSGCSPVVVVIGAAAAEVRAVLTAAFGGDPRLVVRFAAEWAEGMGASLRAGLDAAAEVASAGETESGVVGVLVTLVDTPSLRVETVARMRAAALGGEVRGEGRRDGDALVQATFEGRPGHPVFLGRAHWAQLGAELHGDSGARRYLLAHGAQRVECSDLEPGHDVDSLDPRP